MFVVGKHYAPAVATPKKNTVYL